MSAKAWRYSAVEGLRGAIAIALTVLLAGIAAGLINHVEMSVLASRCAKITTIAFALGFVLLTPYARWGLWRGNQVKSK
jgi:hypothetical protein